MFTNIVYQIVTLNLFQKYLVFIFLKIQFYLFSSNKKNYVILLLLFIFFLALLTKNINFFNSRHCYHLTEAVFHEYDRGTVKGYDVSGWSENNIKDKLLEINRTKQVRPIETFVKNSGYYKLDKQADTGLMINIYVKLLSKQQ